MEHAYGSAGAGQVLRAVICNSLDGGVDADGSAARRDMSIGLIRECGAHLALVQEIRGHARVAHGDFRAWANGLGMEAAALGPPRGDKEQRCGVFTDPSVFQILNYGPAEVRDAPGWAEADLRIRETGTGLYAVSVHAQATTAAGQLDEGDRLAARAARKLSLTGGDQNNYSPEDGLTPADFAWVSERMPWVSSSRLRLADGMVTGNVDVHDTLRLAGLADPVPGLPPDRRFPPRPGATGDGPGRLDRFYLSRRLLSAVLCYHQVRNEASDHAIGVLCLHAPSLARAA